VCSEGWRLAGRPSGALAPAATFAMDEARCSAAEHFGQRGRFDKLQIYGSTVGYESQVLRHGARRKVVREERRGRSTATARLAACRSATAARPLQPSFRHTLMLVPPLRAGHGCRRASATTLAERDDEYITTTPRTSDGAPLPSVL